MSDATPTTNAGEPSILQLPSVAAMEADANAAINAEVNELEADAENAIIAGLKRLAMKLHLPAWLGGQPPATPTEPRS